MRRMLRITVKKPMSRNQDWGIYKNGRRIDAETSGPKARMAARFYRGYFALKPSQRRDYVRKV